MIRVVVKEPDAAPVVREVGALQGPFGQLRAMMAIVGGYIEAVYSAIPGYVLVCNEDGMSQGLEPNWHGILGTFFVTRYDVDGAFLSLTDADVATVMAALA